MWGGVCSLGGWLVGSEGVLGGWLVWVGGVALGGWLRGVGVYFVTPVVVTVSDVSCGQRRA